MSLGPHTRTLTNMTHVAFTTPPEAADIEAVARDTIAGLPDAVRARTGDILVQVHDFPDEDLEADMELETPFDLLGLYQGVPLTEKSVGDVPQDVDTILLFRRPLLDYWCETGEDFRAVVRHVVIHEIGHHFGLSDAEMAAAEAAVP